MTIVLVTNLVQQARRLADRTAFFLMRRLRGDRHGPRSCSPASVKDQRTREYVEGRFG